MTEKLKPCPFCGGEVKEEWGIGVGMMVFDCPNCGAWTIFVAEDGVMDKCREAWNKRTDERTQDTDRT